MIRWANLIIATGHNNAAMNRGILQTARHYVQGDHIAEGMLNRVEAVVRTFDPCLSCSTHAMGRMPLTVELRAPDGSSGARDAEGLRPGRYGRTYNQHRPCLPHRQLRRGTRTATCTPALLLACGNSLREDDGVGLRIAEAAEQLFPASRLRIVAAQQFTPEMAADLAATDLAIFVDASVGDDPGAIRVHAPSRPAQILRRRIGWTRLLCWPWQGRCADTYRRTPLP